MGGNSIDQCAIVGSREELISLVAKNNHNRVNEAHVPRLNEEPTASSNIRK